MNDYWAFGILVLSITNAVMGSCIPILLWRMYKTEDRMRRIRGELKRDIEALDKTVVALLKLTGLHKDED